VIFNRVITQSQIVPLQREITLGVTLDQLPNAIGFEVSANSANHIIQAEPAGAFSYIVC